MIATGDPKSGHLRMFGLATAVLLAGGKETWSAEDGWLLSAKVMR